MAIEKWHSSAGAMMAANDWDVVSTTPAVQSASASDSGNWDVARDIPMRSTLSDVAQGAGRGIVKGIESIAGMPADLAYLGDRAARWIAAHGALKLGLVSPEHAQQFINQAPEADWLHRNLGSEALESGAVEAAQSLGIPLENAQTVPGQYAQTVASFLPASLAGPEGMAKNIIQYGVIPGLMSETAGQITKGTPVEPYARVGAAVAWPASKTALNTLEQLSNPTRNIAAGVTPGQASSAQSLLDQSRAAGAPLTSPEALQAATGSGTRAGDALRIIEQSPEGGAVLKPFFAQRPGQVEALGRQALGEISPTVAEPYEVAPRVQRAAERVVQGARDETNALSHPAYAATANNPNALVSPEALAAIKQQPALEQALSAVRADPVKYGDLRGMPDNAMPVLDAAKKYLDDLGEVAKRAGENFAAANAGRAGDDLVAIMDAEFPRYASARNIQSMRMQHVEEPLARSPIGQLAGADKFPKQAEILFNPNPLPGSQSAVGRAVKDVAKADPEAAQQMVRMHLERTFNEATQNNLPGANQFGGPKFAAIVAGNTQQAKNLEAAVKALPDGAQRWKALNQGLDILQAMGTRQPVGTTTEFNRQWNQILKQSNSPAAEILATVGSPGRWPSFVRNVYERMSYMHNTAEMAKVFAEGDIKDLLALSGQGAKSLKSQAALVSLLGGRELAQESQTPTP